MKPVCDPKRTTEASTAIAAMLRRVLDRKNYQAPIAEALHQTAAYNRLTNTETCAATLRALLTVALEWEADMANLWREDEEEESEAA